MSAFMLAGSDGADCPPSSTHVDWRNRKMTVLCPNQTSVVGRTGIAGSFEYQEM